MHGMAASPMVMSAGVPDTAARFGRKVLFSAMKNEAPFVLEWICLLYTSDAADE